MAKPNLFIVGAAKAGTTSMHAYLEQHPQIYMCRPKEPSHFGADLQSDPKLRILDRERYLKLFDPGADRMYRGEGSVMYLCSKTAAREIHEFNPQAKIIIGLRNPVDMMFSLHRHYLYIANEDIVDFEQALAAEAERRQGRGFPKSAYVKTGLLYTEMATYTPQVKRYFDAFGRANVHVFIFDDLVADTPGQYRKVVEFLGVDASFEPRFDVHNAAKEIPNLTLRRFMRANPRISRAMRAVAPRRIVNSVRDAIGRLTQRQPTKKLDPAVRRRLLEQFRPDIEQLSELLGRDLTFWCDNR